MLTDELTFYFSAHLIEAAPIVNQDKIRDARTRSVVCGPS